MYHSNCWNLCIGIRHISYLFWLWSKHNLLIILKFVNLHSTHSLCVQC